MKKTFAILVALSMLFGLMALSVSAAPEDNAADGVTIPFSAWTSVGNGEWSQNDEGIIAPADAQEWTMLAYSKALGNTYTVEFDVKQPDQNDNIKIGFEVEEGHNFTQSGLVLELHNAGVARIYNWGINSTDEGAYGGCNNGYGGGQGFSKSTDWIHVKIVRDKNDFSVTVNDGEVRGFTFSSSDYNGGHLVLGAVNGRQIEYKNITIKTSVEPPEVIDSNNTFNGNGIPFSDWNNAGNGSWQETEQGVITPDEMGEWLLLRYGKDLGKKFRVELDVRQPDTQHSIMIGFAVEPGQNFTQSGLVLDMHNAGVARIFNWAINSNDESAYGGCNNGYGGSRTFSATTDWVHVIIERDGDHFVVVINDGSGDQKFDFTAEGYEGGYLVLGSNPSRRLQYKDITITKKEDTPPKTGDIGVYTAAATLFAAALCGGAMLLTRKREVAVR